MTLTNPQRIQRRRTKGWRMPSNTVSVTRPGRWGNPFNWREGVEIGGEAWAKGAAVRLFCDWLNGGDPCLTRDGRPGEPPTQDEIRAALRGKNLACFCAESDPCHADILLKIANS